MIVINFPKWSLPVAETKVLVAAALTLHRWVSCQIIIILISSSDCPIWTMLHLTNLPQWSQPVSNGETTWFAGMLSIPAILAGSVMYHLVAQRTLLWRCFACSMLAKTPTSTRVSSLLWNWKIGVNYTEKKNLITVIILKPILFNALHV